MWDVHRVSDIPFESAKYPLYYVHAKSPKKVYKNIFLSAGIHGNEPAGVYALLNFLEKKAHEYLDNFSFIAFPCVNPSGFEYDQRGNIDGINLNLTFNGELSSKESTIVKQFIRKSNITYAFAMDMHEDDTYEKVDGYTMKDNPKEFYLYEVSHHKNFFIGPKIIHALECQGIPICKREQIYYEKCNKNGLILSNGILDPSYRDVDTLDGYLQNFTKHIFTPETPTCWSLDKRISVQMKTLLLVLDEYIKVINQKKSDRK